MSRALLRRLEEWKGRYGTADPHELEKLLPAVAAGRWRDPAELARLHETLLFLRAYPHSIRSARLADEILFGFAGRITDPEPFEEPEISGVAGTSLTAVFSYEVAKQLAARYPREIEIGWDRYDEQDRLGPILRRFLPMLREDYPVEAHVPFQDWIGRAHRKRLTDLAWLLDQLSKLPSETRADIYEAMQMPLTWRMGQSKASRSRMRLPLRNWYVHNAPLIRRGEVSIARELAAPKLRLKRLDHAEARRVMAAIVDTSAMRYRELYGFSHPDERAVYHAAPGRGIDIYFFSVSKEWRLPLRAYHGGMFFKNGVPSGYVELLSLFERAEVGFNLYYTFREGESAWIYAQLLRVFHQVLGVTCFSVDPYQIGHENPEAVDSGAFWFYRKLGFRPTDPEVARLVEREERRMSATPGYRSSRRTLERLAEGYILYEMPGTESGDWDRFRVRKLAHNLDSVPSRSEPDTAYLRSMQKARELRARWIRLGS